MYCPNCKTEYREGFFRCTDCGGQLADAPPADRHSFAEELPTDKFDAETEVIPAYLTTANTPNEAQILESLLASYGIPVMRKFKGAGAYSYFYIGNTCSGVDLFVPSNALEAATNLINAETVDEIAASNDEIEITDNGYTSRRVMKVLLILASIIWTITSSLFVGIIIAAVFTALLFK